MNGPTNRVCVTFAVSVLICYILLCVLNVTNYSSYQTDFIDISDPYLSNSSVFSPPPKFTNNISTDFIQTEKVVIGLVSCRTGPLKGNMYYDQTFTLIKSLLISCKLYNIPTLEIHLFLEHVKDEEYFQNEIKEKLYFPDNERQIQLTLQVHSAVDAVPKEYRDHMVYHPRFRCGYVRFFYPESLPNVDSIIHLDSDVIVTGNIGKHWQLLSEMNDTQMISVGYSRQPVNNEFSGLDKHVFKGTPFVPPKGVSSGLLVMNLTRMREFKMSEKLTRVYQDYSRISGLELHDMKVLNILLYFNPGLYSIFPCQLQFIPTECEKGFFCESAYQDPDGLHLMHGNVGKFMKNQIFHPIYKYYSKFNISDPQSNLTRDLMEPIQKAYLITNSTPLNPCYGNLDKTLFKRFLHILS